MKNLIFIALLVLPLLTNAQYVGIGTIEPSQILHIMDSTPIVRIQDAGVNYSALEFGGTENNLFSRTGEIRAGKYLNGPVGILNQFGFNFSTTLEGMSLSHSSTTLHPDRHRVILKLVHPDSTLSTSDFVGLEFASTSDGYFSKIQHGNSGLDILSGYDALTLRSGFVSGEPSINMKLDNLNEVILVDTTSGFLFDRDNNSLLAVNGQMEARELLLTSGAVEGHILTSDADGKASWEPMTVPHQLLDGDNDTQITVELTNDEDRIRFGVSDMEMASLDNEGFELNGIFETFDENTRHLFIQGPKIAIENSGNSVFLGKGAGEADDLSLNENTFIGNNSGETNTGIRNTLIGANAGQITTNQDENTFIGWGAGQASASSENVLVGTSAGGGNNNVIGKNVMIGHLAGQNSSGSGNVYIGHKAGQTETRSNLLIIDNNDGGAPLITGDFIADSVNIGGVMKIGNASGSQLYVGNTLIQSGGTNSLRFDAAVRPLTDIMYELGGMNKRWTTVYAANGIVTTSDMRAKKNITDLGYGLKDIMKLRPVQFHWNEEAETKEAHLGLIAQELNTIIPEVVEMPENEADLLGVKYSDLIPVLIKGMQEQQELIEKQQQQIEYLLKRSER